MKLRDMTQPFYREFVWIPINRINIQGFVFLMEAPQIHASITYDNTSMESPENLWIKALGITFQSVVKD
jgi:hypothetical protein